MNKDAYTSVALIVIHVGPYLFAAQLMADNSSASQKPYPLLLCSCSSPAINFLQHSAGSFGSENGWMSIIIMICFINVDLFSSILYHLSLLIILNDLLSWL